MGGIYLLVDAPFIVYTTKTYDINNAILSC